MGQQAAAGTPSREPQQGRSKASFERMLTAAEKLLKKKGSDDFTLTEVSKAGKVSIGSIYLRFDGKDALIRAVQQRVLERVDAEQQQMLTEARTQASGLGDFMERFVEGFAESLKRHGPILRPIMLRAMYDSSVSSTGRGSHDRFAAEVKLAMLHYRTEFGQTDHQRLVDSAYRVIYATLARYLGLGSSSEASGEGDWDEVKSDLGTMCAAFLRHRPAGPL